MIVSGCLGARRVFLARFVKRFGAVPNTLDHLLKVNEAQTETISVLLNANCHHSQGLGNLAEALKKIGCNGNTDKSHWPCGRG